MTSSAVVAQVWRDGRKQVRLAQLLGGVCVRALAREDRRTGELLAAAGADDVVDGYLSLCVADGDHVLTSDRRDIDRLLAARAADAVVIDV